MHFYVWTELSLPRDHRHRRSRLCAEVGRWKEIAEETASETTLKFNATPCPCNATNNSTPTRRRVARAPVAENRCVWYVLARRAHWRRASLSRALLACARRSRAGIKLNMYERCHFCAIQDSSAKLCSRVNRSDRHVVTLLFSMFSRARGSLSPRQQSPRHAVATRMKIGHDDDGGIPCATSGRWSDTIRHKRR